MFNQPNAKQYNQFFLVTPFLHRFSSNQRLLHVSLLTDTKSILFLTLFYTGSIYPAPLGFFVIKPFKEKKFISNQLEF